MLRRQFEIRSFSFQNFRFRLESLLPTDNDILHAVPKNEDVGKLVGRMYFLQYSEYFLPAFLISTDTICSGKKNPNLFLSSIFSSCITPDE